MRSSAGVGTTPPNVPGAPNPLSSVMISSTLGAPFGGTTRGAHQDFDSEAFSLITPPNFGSDGGSCFPLMVVVAPGEPNSPVTCSAAAGPARRVRTANRTIAFFILSPLRESRSARRTYPAYGLSASLAESPHGLRPRVRGVDGRWARARLDFQAHRLRLRKRGHPGQIFVRPLAVELHDSCGRAHHGGRGGHVTVDDESVGA